MTCELTTFPGTPAPVEHMAMLDVFARHVRADNPALWDGPRRHCDGASPGVCSFHGKANYADPAGLSAGQMGDASTGGGL